MPSFVMISLIYDHFYKMRDAFIVILSYNNFSMFFCRCCGIIMLYLETPLPEIAPMVHSSVRSHANRFLSSQIYLL